VGGALTATATGAAGDAARDRASAPLPTTFAEAFADLYRPAYRAAYRLLGDRAEAEDIAQEACARACMRWNRLSDPTPWVVRVAANLALDRWRRVRTATRHQNRVTIDLVTAEADERRVDLHRALATLPARQRQVVVLRYLADLTEAQTADALGCAVGTVKAHASRGLSSLRDVLAKGTES
jgi:RNA polymerase sigma-70 factor (ECF subfamily)